MNFSPWAHPYNGKRTDIFSTDNSFEIMESYQVFILLVFNTVARTHLCSQAVQNQVMALFGGKASYSILFGNSDECTGASNIINEVDDSLSFELLE
jgi:hypothetical protein